MVPRPSPEFVALRTGAQALVRTLGRKRAERFLREWARMLSVDEGVTTLLPRRPASDHAAVELAREQARTWFQSVLPAILDAVPDE